MTRHPVHLSSAVLLIAILVLVITGCEFGSPVEGPPGPILVIGIDGASEEASSSSRRTRQGILQVHR